MKAILPGGDIHLRFREEDFGRVAVPGLEVETDDGKVRVYEKIDSAFAYIRKLHDDNLKRKPE